MQQMTFTECVKRSWASAWDAARQMPVPVLATFAILAVVGWLVLPSPSDAVPDDVSAMHRALVKVAVALAQAVVYCWLSIKVHRFVLLGERTLPLMPLGGRPLGRLLLVSFGVTLTLVATGVLLLLTLRPKYQGGVNFLVVVLYAIWLFVLFRVSLLFPAISLGSRIAPGAAWRDSQGNLWSMIGVSCIASLPLVVFALVFLAFAALLLSHEGMLNPRYFLIGMAILQALANTAFIVLASASLAWLYRRHANELAGGSAGRPHRLP